MATTSDSTVQRKGFSMTDVVTNAVEPGVNHSVLMFVNIVFLLLILTIILIIGFSTGYRLYMLLLLILAFGLFIGFNKFVATIIENETTNNNNTEEITGEDKTTSKKDE